MNPTAPSPSFRAAIATALFLASGVVGSVIGRAYGAALGTTPAWVGPVILIGSLGCFVVALLLMPAAIRGVRARRAAQAGGQRP